MLDELPDPAFIEEPLFLCASLLIAASNWRVLRRLSDYPSAPRWPRVSILVPARDEEANIGPCVDSLLAQRYPDMQVIVLDDESSDGTHRVILLFGDAPPHDRDLTLVEATCREFKGVIHAADVGQYGRGATAAAMPAFRSIAEWGRGSAVTLTDELDLLKNVLVLTLGPRYRTQVETLFGL